MHVKVTYDGSADAAYVYLAEFGAGASKEQVEALEGRVILDLDAEGRLLGLEVLTARTMLCPETLESAENIDGK
jgi:uncharacterized protein YuzE